MKRIIALILCAIMLCSTLVACSKDEGAADDSLNTNAEESTASTVNEDDSIPPEYQDDLPSDLNYNGKTVVVLSSNEQATVDEISVERTNGNVVNDAIFKREQEVESRLNVDIYNELKATNGNSWAIMKTLITSIEAGEDAYDIVVGPAYRQTTGSILGHFYNLNNENISTYMNLDKSYWMPQLNEAAAYNGAQFIATGYLALTMYRYMYATYFNSTIMENNHIDIYDLVENGRWTLQKQAEIATQVAEEKGGDGAVIEPDVDVLGLSMETTVSFDALWSTCGISICKPDSNGGYSLVLYEQSNYERLTNTVTQIFKMSGMNGIHMNESGEGWDLDMKRFAAGNSAMTVLKLSYSELSSMTRIEYGIAPIPMLEEGQTNVSYIAHDQFSVFSIPVSIPKDQSERLQMLGAVLEALNSWSYANLRPAYYEKALKSRYMSDERSWAVLDDIMANVTTDVGFIYTHQFEAIHQQLRYITDTPNSTFGDKRIKVTSAYNTWCTTMADLAKSHT